MARRKGNPINGWLVLDKALEMTSTQAVGKARFLFNAQKAGHAGTLDPLATGILPIAFGEATKTVPFIMDAKKTYRFTVQWGAETDTDDTEGRIINESALRPMRADIEAALKDFRGEIMQTPPRFSAIKIEGERAYDLARDGEDFELQARPVTIDRLEIIEASQDTCVFEADCGKGTYVRALARDLGCKLGCLGHIIQLRRTRVGPFLEKDALTFDKILERREELGHSADQSHPDLTGFLLPVETALDDIPALALSSTEAQRLRRGQSVLLRGRDAPVIKGQVCAMSQGVLVALAEVKKGELHPIRVFHIATH